VENGDMDVPCQCKSGQCKSGDKTHANVRCPSAILALGLLVTGFQVAAEEQTAAGQETAAGAQTVAVLKQREVDFSYRSSAAPFSCNDLEGRVAVIMRALGARDDVAVTANGCDAVVTPSYGRTDPRQNRSSTWQTPSTGWQTSADPIDGTAGHEQSAHIRIRAMMPVEATPEVLSEMDKDKSRRELISRVTGNPAANLNDPIVFHAQRQRVTLSHRTIKLQPEDCELLEQMSRGVFRKLGIRTVSSGPRCDRREISHMPPQLTVEALMPVMPAGPQLQIAPGEGSSDPGAPAASDTSGTESSEPATAAPEE
jgi:hypothetical protein